MTSTYVFLLLVAAGTATVSTIALLVLVRARTARERARYVYTAKASDGRSLRLETWGIQPQESVRTALVDIVTERAGEGSANEVVEALDRMATRDYRPIVEQIRVEYRIGDSRDNDALAEAHVTEPAEADKPVYWREVTTKPIGPGVPRPRSFEELEDLRIVEKIDGQERDLQCIPLAPSDEEAKALVLFRPQVEADSAREWTWSCRIPGLWNPLRDRHEDRAVYYVGPDVECTRLVVSFVFPANYEQPVVEDLGKKPVQPQMSVTPRGDRSYTFDFVRPAVGHYRWALRVAGFHQRGKVAS